MPHTVPDAAEAVNVDDGIEHFTTGSARISTTAGHSRLILPHVGLCTTTASPQSFSPCTLLNYTRKKMRSKGSNSICSHTKQYVSPEWPEKKRHFLIRKRQKIAKLQENGKRSTEVHCYCHTHQSVKPRRLPSSTNVCQ